MAVDGALRGRDARAMDDRRKLARELAGAALARGEPLAWFEELYRAAREEGATVPWADLAPSPELLRWLEEAQPPLDGRRVAVVGAGYGDDAALLAARGAQVAAFDCAPSAVAVAVERFAGSRVEWIVADVLRLPRRLELGFDLVVEVNTLQVLPRDLRTAAAAGIASLVAPGGELFVAARLRLPGEPEGAMPWPLLEQELAAFEAAGLVRGPRAVLLDDEEPPVRRISASFVRPSHSVPAG